MKATEIFKSILKAKGITQLALAEKKGVRPQSINDILKAKSMHVGTAVQLAALLDYKVVIVPADAPLPKDGYKVEA